MVQECSAAFDDSDPLLTFVALVQEVHGIETGGKDGKEGKAGRFLYQADNLRGCGVQFARPGDSLITDVICLNQADHNSVGRASIVDSCSNQMVPGSIPGDRISFTFVKFVQLPHL